MATRNGHRSRSRRLLLAACAAAFLVLPPSAAPAADVYSGYAKVGNVRSSHGGLYATGAYHVCATDSSGGLRCWGDNSAGELGDGTTKNSTTPVAVIGLPAPAVEVGASYDRTCALLSSGQVRCWGRVAAFSSTGKPKNSSKPVKVSGVPFGAHGLSVGVTHTCVLDGSNIPWCWGQNDRGQIGDGKTKTRTAPAKTKAKPALELSASDGYTCAVFAAGGVGCWGRSHGTANDPLNPEGLVVNSKNPLTIVGLETAVDVSATGDFACATLADGAVSCWGENDHGQLGDGTVTGRAQPQVVALPEPAYSVAATANHACVLMADRQMCWGRGDHGQMGNGTYDESRVPVDVVGLGTGTTKVIPGASGHYVLALKTDGSVWGWGRNESGQIGDGTTSDRSSPVQVVTLP